MKSILKLLVINLLVFVLLIAIVECCAMLILDLKTASRTSEQIDPRALLPNYTDTTWAHDHFKEFTSLRTDYKSYYGWRRKPFKGKTITIDSFGIRTTPNTNYSAPAIVFLGGSTMWGTGSPDAETIPSIFNQRTQGQFCVINYGETAYNAYQSSIFLQTQIAKKRLNDIRLIISYDGVNNAYYHKNHFTHFREEQINQLLSGQDQKKKAYLFMSYTRRLIKKIKSRNIPIEEKVITNDEHQLAAYELLDSWLITQSIAQRNKADFICILQPNIFVGHPGQRNFNSTVDLKRKASYLYYDYVKEILYHNEKYESLRDCFIDMTNVFDHKDHIYVDFCHVSPNGNKIMVEYLIEHLRQSDFFISAKD